MTVVAHGWVRVEREVRRWDTNSEGELKLFSCPQETRPLFLLTTIGYSPGVPPMPTLILNMKRSDVSDGVETTPHNPKICWKYPDARSSADAFESGRDFGILEIEVNKSSSTPKLCERATGRESRVSIVIGASILFGAIGTWPPAGMAVAKIHMSME